MSRNYKEDIKAAVPISQYLEDRGVKMSGKTRAVATWRGGRNPNVAIDDEKGAWIDFKSGDKGDLFDLFMKIEGGDFATAVKTLGERYAVPQVEGDPSRRSSSWRPRRPSAPRLTPEEEAEERRKNLDTRLRQFVPVALRDYWKTSAAGHSTADIFAESIRMTDADLHLDDLAYRRQAARQLRDLFRPGDRIWAGWIVKDPAVRDRVGLRYTKTPLTPAPGQFADRDAYALALRGIYDAYALAADIEKGVVAEIPPSVSLNPVTGMADENGSFDSSATVAAYRNALVEWDHLKELDAEGVAVPTENHIEIAAGLADYSFDRPELLRVASATYTGGKSIHIALRIEAADLAAYERQTDALADLFRSADDETFRADDQTGWDNGYTHIRLAGAIRPETGRRARLLVADDRLATPDFSTPPCGTAEGRGLCGVCLHLGECPFASKTAVRGTTLPPPRWVRFFPAKSLLAPSAKVTRP